MATESIHTERQPVAVVTTAQVEMNLGSLVKPSGLAVLGWVGLELSRAVKLLLAALLIGYQRLISPALGPRCRFMPSCSAYARQCLQRYGLWRALGKTAWRLMRCHPFCKGGYDPP